MIRPQSLIRFCLLAGGCSFGAVAGWANGQENNGPVLEPPAETSRLVEESRESAPAARSLPPLPPPREAAPDEPSTSSAPARLFAEPDADGRATSPPRPQPGMFSSFYEERMPAPEAVGPRVYPVERIKYDTDRGARRLYAKSGGVIDIVMITQNPADGCYYEIPLCLPACCVGEPRVSSGRGLLGRGVVEYCWDCGLTVKVKFRLRGDVKVDYDG